MHKQESLIDSFGRRHSYLRLSVTDRCNLRCIYCMPSDGVSLKDKRNILTFDEIERLISIAAGAGITKVRITGGEPLVRKDLPMLIKQITSINGIQHIGITTNGVLLHQQLPALLDAGASSFNISLDTLRPERFRSMTLHDEFSAVMKSIDSVLKIEHAEIKLNVVIMGGVNDDELIDFVEFAHLRRLTIRFIEFMPFKNNAWTPSTLVTYDAMKQKIEEQFTLIPALEQSSDADVAKLFQIPGWAGTIGFITPMSRHFCASCNRIRIGADGTIKACLFSSTSTDLREALRSGASDDAIVSLLQQALSDKLYEHTSPEQLHRLQSISMSQIGG